eukprot:5624785-Amphidinium_carterae.1
MLRAPGSDANPHARLPVPPEHAALCVTIAIPGRQSHAKAAFSVYWTMHHAHLCAGWISEQAGAL